MPEALSSNHFSTDLQADDVVANFSYPAVVFNDGVSEDDFHKAFPEYKDRQWSGSGFDTDAMGVDVEWGSWVIDWIEQNTNVRWEEGEPWAYGPDDTDEDEYGC